MEPAELSQGSGCPGREIISLSEPASHETEQKEI